MTARTPNRRRRPGAVTTLLFITGLWLAISPWVLGFSWDQPAWSNAVVIGVALVILAALRFAYPRRFEGIRWTVLILGAWMIASPYVANYADISAATINAIIVGALTIFGALVAATRPATRPT